MKIIFKIARTELRNLFYSPVAWFLFISFLVQCAVLYTTPILHHTKWQDFYLRNYPKWRSFGRSLTDVVFFKDGGIFDNVLQNLYLFIPLLTMGVISRESDNGTIRLLYSSPVRLRQMVLGKYLAIMCYNLLLVFIVGIFIVSAVFNIRSLDYGMLLSSALGFYLLVCAYTAIGVFMSSLTRYQIISAIGTFLIIFILGRIGMLWQQYDLVRDLTWFLSLSGRTDNMLAGLITTKDVLYFIIIVYIFLGFTLIKLRSGRESRSWLVGAARYFAVLATALIIGYIGSRPSLTGYWDTTAQQLNTLDPKVQQIVRDLGKDPLEVTLYGNLLSDHLPKVLPEARNSYLSDLWERYLRFKPDIRFKYAYYYDMSANYFLYREFPNKSIRQIAEKVAKGYETDLSLFKTPEEIHRIIDLGREDFRMIMQLNYKGRTLLLRTYNDKDFWPDDMNIAAAFKRLMLDTLPKVYFVTGDLERNVFKSGSREYEGHTLAKGARSSLINIGFDADTVSLDNRDIPADAEIVVLADPKTRLSDQTSDRLRQYIAKGGNLFILGEPGKQSVLNPVLEQLGVQLMAGTVVEPTFNETPDMVKPYFTEASLNLSDILIDERDAWKRKDFDDTLDLRMPGVTALSYTAGSPFVVKPLLMTVPGRTWLKQGRLVTDSAAIVYNPGEGDVKGSFATALGLTRQVNGREQRIVVSGDADCLSNERLDGLFALNTYSWLDNNKFPVLPYVPPPKDTRFWITHKTANLLRILYVWILPALVLIFGTVLLIRRKRK